MKSDMSKKMAQKSAGRGRLIRYIALLAAVASLATSLTSASAEEDGAEAPEGPKKIRRRIESPLVSDPRGEPDLVVCSQNLKMLAVFEAPKQKAATFAQSDHRDRVLALARRMADKNCDVIAVQEIMGKNEEAATTSLRQLSEQLQKISNRVYTMRVAPVAEGGMTVGFLVADDRATILSSLSYAKVELPKLTPKEKPRVFPRTPLEVQLQVKSRDSDLSKIVSVVNMHFKSKRGGASDPTGLEWETFRIQMSEALRRIVERRHKQAFANGESILMVVGDRNANFDAASARVLEGILALSSFKNDGGCRLSKRGVPLCKAEASMPQRLFSVLTSNRSVFSLPGTFLYKDEYSWLDDILMPAESLRYCWKTASSEGSYNSGVVYSPKNASDHAMVWAALNF
jgi:hypothetical protein